MLVVSNLITGHSFFVTPKPVRNTENSADLCLALVHNHFSAERAPSLGTNGLTFYLL